MRKDKIRNITMAENLIYRTSKIKVEKRCYVNNKIVIQALEAKIGNKKSREDPKNVYRESKEIVHEKVYIVPQNGK